jgi:integrase/recombinase XerD
MQIITFVLQYRFTMNKESSQKQVYISICLDSRRAKANGLYPVKLRAFTSAPRVQKMYPTKFEFTKDQFEKIYETAKPRSEFKEIRQQIQSIEIFANKIASEIVPFSFEKFEKKLFRKPGEGENVFYQYEQTISRLKENKQLGTASNYHLSQLSIKNFLNHSHKKDSNKLFFKEITPQWLEKYENYMLEVKNLSRTTVSMYLRCLRTLFNSAISENEIEPDIYPFGKRKYQIPSVKNVKKSLSREDLKKLFEANTKNPEQEKAKDFWFFSYSCNGMNIKDIALLKWENINDEKLTFYRAKTINTSKSDLRPVTVYLTEFAKSIIKKYSNLVNQPKGYIFPILDQGHSEELKRAKIQNFTRFINQNIKKLAISEGITSDISTYWARHSFATNAIRNGASMEFVSEALNHSNMKTTQGYFAGFEENSKRDLMETLMTF